MFGVLAQLVERLNGIEEVRGSNPLGSTISQVLRVVLGSGESFTFGFPKFFDPFPVHRRNCAPFGRVDEAGERRVGAVFSGEAAGMQR